MLTKFSGKRFISSQSLCGHYKNQCFRFSHVLKTLFLSLQIGMRRTKTLQHCLYSSFLAKCDVITILANFLNTAQIISYNLQFIDRFKSYKS